MRYKHSFNRFLSKSSAGRIIQQFRARDFHLFHVRWNSPLIEPAVAQARLESERNFVGVWKVLPQKGL
jgi:hypothetical protein